ncbi:MAG: glycosyltransferase family 4 protein [Bacteroidia bacterium]|nr:glycosyltransferase family 4 protein [Bacteroidia bacterium]
MNTIRVIFIISFVPKYDYFETITELKNKSLKYWYNPDGKIIAILHEWAYIIGKKITEIDNNIYWEIWRPDYNADKEYIYVQNEKIIHRIFPAEKKTYLDGIRKIRGESSLAIIAGLNKIYELNEKIILIIPFSKKPICKNTLKLYRGKFPILTTHFTNISEILKEIKFFVNPFRLFHEIAKHYQSIYLLKIIDNLQVSNLTGLDKIKTKYKKNIFFWSPGLNVNEFRSRYSARNEARKHLNIPIDKFVILNSSRIVPEKQIDKLLYAINQTCRTKKKQFLLIITSYGNQNYINYLKNIACKFSLSENIKFTGHISKEELEMLYYASNMFFMGSTHEAGPLSTLLAIAAELPIISTDTGLGAEILKKYNCGIIISPIYGKSWINAFNIAFDGQEIKTMNPDDLKNELDENMMYKKRLIPNIKKIYTDFYI